MLLEGGLGMCVDAVAQVDELVEVSLDLHPGSVLHRGAPPVGADSGEHVAGYSMTATTSPLAAGPPQRP